MLEQINIIDECDVLGQKLDAGVPVHMALVLVYKDLLLFYLAVIRLLTRKSTALAWISEQFNERIPPIVQDFLRHADQLQTHISNATSEIVKSLEELLLDNKLQQLLGARALSQLDEFHIDLTRKIAEDACRWVLADPTFVQWHSAASTGRPLVLHGEMGCGKTVTMSFIVNSIRRLSESQIPRPLLCYHYCRDDETGKALYIYASLIQQLMRQKARVKVQFNRWCEERQSQGHHAPAQDSALLSEFFFDTVKGLERPLFVSIDGLDECRDQSMVDIATSLMKYTREIPGLRACVSARHREDIRDLLRGALEMPMQTHADRDAIIVTHMVKDRLSFLDAKARNLVVDRLTMLAKGTAIWVQMAVDLLAIRKIRATGKLSAFLRDELPQSKLSDLYAKLFTQVIEDDEENARVLTDALEILAVADRPLSIAELGCAVALRDPETDEATTVEELDDYVDAKRVLGLVSPFIASVNFDDTKTHQVRLLHQSVRELILKTSPGHWSTLRTSSSPTSASASVPSEAVQRRQSELQGRSAQMCVRYLLLDDLEDKSLFSENQTWAQALDDLPGLDVYYDSDDQDDQDAAGGAAGDNPRMAAPPPLVQQSPEDNLYDPSDRGFGDFFVYASCYWMHHLRRTTQEHGIALSDFVALTTQGTTRLQSWWDQFLRPDCTLRAYEMPWRPDSLLIASLYGPDHLLLDLLRDLALQQLHDTDTDQKSSAAAVHAVLRDGELDRLPLLIQYDGPGRDITPAMNRWCDSMRAWTQRVEFGRMMAKDEDGFNRLFDHMEGALDLMVEQEWGNEILCSAASSGCLPVLQRLFAAAEGNPALRRELLRTPQRDDGGRSATAAVRHQSIGDALWNGQDDAVRCLLEQQGIDAHLRSTDVMGNTVFHKAARHRTNGGSLELLIARFPEGINQKNNSDDTPLHVLVFNGNTELAEVLLASGHADVRGGSIEQPSSWHDPIRMAARAGNVAMCEVLVRVGGVDPMSIFDKEEDSGEWRFMDPMLNEDVAARVRDTLFSLSAERQTK